MARHGGALRRLRGGRVPDEGPDRARSSGRDLLRLVRVDREARDDPPRPRPLARARRVPRSRAAVARSPSSGGIPAFSTSSSFASTSSDSRRAPRSGRGPCTTSSRSSFSGSCRAWRSSFAASGGACAASDEGFFFFVWFTVVFVFFSVSGSKLPPYLFPAIPAAAVLAALGMPKAGARGPWIVAGRPRDDSRRRAALAPGAPGRGEASCTWRRSSRRPSPGSSSRPGWPCCWRPARRAWR